MIYVQQAKQLSVCFCYESRHVLLSSVIAGMTHNRKPRHPNLLTPGAVASRYNYIAEKASQANHQVGKGD